MNKTVIMAIVVGVLCVFCPTKEDFDKYVKQKRSKIEKAEPGSLYALDVAATLAGIGRGGNLREALEYRSYFVFSTAKMYDIPLVGFLGCVFQL